MTTDKRMKLTHLIKKLTDESVEQLLETACKLFAANTIAQRPDCPYCQSSSIVKNGHKCGKQEYRCKECRKTFVSTTNTLMSRSTDVNSTSGYSSSTRRFSCIPCTDTLACRICDRS